MDDSQAISMNAIRQITTFDQLKAFEKRVYQMDINWTLRDKLIRQATQNFAEASPLI